MPRTNATDTAISNSDERKGVDPLKAAPKRPTSKKSKLIALLGSRNGARTPTLCKTLGWQKHTVRAALSGLRKEGYVVDTSRSARDGVTIYRITAQPEHTQ